MASRAIVTACSGDPGYFEAFVNDWCLSLTASTDLRDTDVWLIDYGLTAGQQAAVRDRGVRLVTAVRDGSVPNIRWRDLPRVLEQGGPYSQVMMADGSDMYFQRDVGRIFDLATERIAVAGECYGDLSRDHYLELSRDCLSAEETRFCLRQPPINTGLVCGPVPAMRELCDFVVRRIPASALAVAGPDYVVINYYLHRRGFELLHERFNFIAITSRRRPRVVDGQLWSGGEPVYVIHNAAAGMGVFQNFGYPNDRLGVNRRVLAALRRGWIRYALLRRLPILRRLTAGGRMLAGGAAGRREAPPRESGSPGRR